MRTFAVAKMIVVNQEGKILALRRSKDAPRRAGEWDIPGGHVEDGEDIMVAAVRETEEEASIKVNDCRLVYGQTDNKEDFGSGTWSFFLSHVQGEDFNLSEEHSEGRWLTIDEVLNKFKYDRHLVVFKYLKDNKIL